MAPRTLRFLPPVFAVVFSILALVFSLLAVTSRKWAVRNNYDRLLNPVDFTCPIFTLYRSPFIICTAHELPLNKTAQASVSSSTPTFTATSSSSTSSTKSTGCAAPTSKWEVNCHHYRPFGFDKTSCELEVATQTDTASNVGDARLCQQIHYAGNFGITSTLFIGLGFILTGTMAMMTLHNARKATRATSQPLTESQKGENIQVNNEAVDPAITTTGPNGSGFVRSQASVVASYLSLVLLVFLFMGVVTGIIAQYFGILGLIQSQPNQADFAGSGGNSDAAHGNHGPWYQAVGLSTYATCAWSFAAAAGTIVAMTWEVPRWNSLL
ncbi:hypothetical protein LTR47_004025 [Exophiala xenobiotica]|nr:hypothetical protein LTR41_002337 [Exophiala xenobiotica]KAK5217773.1 hypothetical protein LTR72_009436 [Exophiala xenobiotica]KAK5235189.1 hypothetical protein LTR47_004025 [Exophiala xenobiotica]KAK5254371.1 hypothetical protein LTS06_001205 [Exophiala xenobiotica]KAK5260678.1 hypothetical protein LTR40_003708 [Exophiala xenobiotica]